MQAGAKTAQEFIRVSPRSFSFERQLFLPRSQTPFGNAPPGNSVSCYNAPMTRTRYRIFQTEYAYFLTCTVVGWVPLFTRPEAVDILFDSWRYLQQNRHFLIYGLDHKDQNSFLVLLDLAWENAYVQTCKASTLSFLIEYRDGATKLHYRAKKAVSVETVKLMLMRLAMDWEDVTANP
jgi:hypothetical protein